MDECLTFKQGKQIFVQCDSSFLVSCLNIFSDRFGLGSIHYLDLLLRNIERIGPDLPPNQIVVLHEESAPSRDATVCKNTQLVLTREDR